MPRPQQYVIVWKDGGNGEGPDVCQYASKAAAIDALEQHGVEKALCVVRGTYVEFGQSVTIKDSAPRARKPNAQPAPGRRKKRSREAGSPDGQNGRKVDEDFFEKPNTSENQ